MHNLLLTHISFIFKRKLTVITPAMEMSSPLTIKRAIRRPAFFCGSEPLESFLYDCRIFSVVVSVHLHIGRTNVHLITGALRIKKKGLYTIFSDDFSNFIVK